VPIVKDGKLVGIVSRANLVQALATARKQVKAATATSDQLIREDVIARLRTEPWAKANRINVIVHDGAVEAEKQAIRVAVELTPGVRAVTDNLVVDSLTSSSRLIAA
jgi:osmotically-inducible protein OsmY